MAQAPWWVYSRIDNFGMRDPAGNFWKPDSNIQIPGGYPIEAISSGTITSLQHTSFGEDVITLKLDVPFNSLATHQFYEHLSSYASGLSVGQHVSAGQVIAYNNPGGSVPLGFGFYSGDTYGSGAAWNTLQSDVCPGCANQLNPVKFLDAAKGSKSPPSGVGGSTLLASSNPLSGAFDWLTSSPLWVWIQNPVRLLKMVAGIGLIVVGLVMLIVPETATKVGKFAIKHPEIAAL